MAFAQGRPIHILRSGVCIPTAVMGGFVSCDTHGHRRYDMACKARRPELPLGTSYFYGNTEWTEKTVLACAYL